MSSTAAMLSPKNTSAGKDWLRALERTAPIARNPHRILPVLLDELAGRYGDVPALLSERECFSFHSLAERSNQYARWALRHGVRKGDVVGLLMTSRPEYFAAWIGITAVGGVVALLNTSLVGRSLWHCVDVVRPGHVIVASEFAQKFSAAMPASDTNPRVWIHGTDHRSFFRIDSMLDELSTESLSPAERSTLAIDDPALYIYTSGTTGLPKAANVSHGRILQWACWFAGMLDIQPEDRMYNCLPMYHSIGGVLVPGAALVSGASVAIRETFSAGQFWNDVSRWDCTMFQYIGEFCRYLLNTPSTHKERNHRVRLACGNGLSADVWRDFQKRFHVPRIVEFYASTEGGLSLFNTEGEPGAIGRVPPYLAHRYSPVLVRFDAEAGEPIRDEQGFCTRCDVNEPGEALARFRVESSQAGSRFEGYTDPRATEKKLLRDVFESGDVWVRTGDLMRRDERGFFYFVDRVGDTFRWKGENVATTEVAEIAASFPGVVHAVVYGVKVGAAEGRVGMAALSSEADVDLAALRRHLISSLPTYARPAFFRLRQDCELTGTFKYSKSELVRQGFNPDLSPDAIYFDNPQTKTLQPVDRALFRRIQSGQIRL
jgi:fatty-acyl-CoA synthase